MHRSFLLRFSAFTAFTALCAAPVLAMQGGKPAAANDPMAQISVAVQAHQESPDGTMRVSECTGVRIADDLVLTAAHCLDNTSDPARVAVFAYQGAQAVPPYGVVTRIIRHPRHKPHWGQEKGTIGERQQELTADMALLKLGSALPAPSRNARVGAKGEHSVIMGAGMNGTGANAGSGQLKTTVLGNITFTKTGAQLAFASPASGQVCRGDSGGAIGANGTIWGITGAILRGKGGCSNRFVVVPVKSDDPAFQAMLKAAAQ